MESEIKINNEQKENKKPDLEKKDDKEKSILSKVVILSLFISCVVGGIFGFLAGGITQKNILEKIGIETGKEDSQQASENINKIDSWQEDSLVVGSVESASPAVVSIIVTKDVPKLESYFFSPFFSDPFFDPFGFQEEQGQPETEKREIGGGTGFIVDKDGYIITNKHVVDDADAEYTVMMNDGKKIEAKVLDRDSYLDVAILKIEEKNLPTVKLGNSDELKIGQTVIAIGNSLGEFRNTVSKGIVSGLKRNVNAGNGMGQTELLEEVIQTDAAINPGNSGGPLLNLNGQVIAINVAMAQGAENIGFAIPINQIKKIYQSVKETGKISRPYLGVRYLVLNEQIKKENNLPVNYGALVVRGERRIDLAVIPGSPADKAGIVENDIILEIDGQKIGQENDLARIIRKKNVGDTIKLKVWSKGSEKTINVTLEEANN